MGKREVEMPDGSKKTFIWSPKYDPRFPQFNGASRCSQYFLDFQKCTWRKGDDYKPCDWFRHHYQHTCPPVWIERWDAQLAEGKFPSTKFKAWQKKYPKAAEAEE